MREYIESQMDFSPIFENSYSIYIEKSQIFAKFGDGVKSVEFLTLLPGKKLYFIEAKSSAPNPDNGEDFKVYCEELLEKFQHSIDLFASKELGVHRDSESEFPDDFKEGFHEYRLYFLLIINNHKQEWCSDVLDGLQRKFIALRKIWKLEIIVWTGDKARDKRFIV